MSDLEAPDGYGFDYVHRTVLRDEVVRAIDPRAGGIYADVTLGGGGHAEAILDASSRGMRGMRGTSAEAVEGARLVGIDRDAVALAAASRRLARFGGRVRVVHGPFGDAGALLPPMVEEITSGARRTVDGLVADLGVSSPQLDDPSRGMSLRREASSAPIDMRMDRSAPRTARMLIDELSEEALADALFAYGEERRSRRIARSIKEAAARGELATTGDLRHAVYRAVGGTSAGGIDPATRTFQALRIAVNDELGELERLLGALPALVEDGGVVAIISFHSLEDRRVKHALGGEGGWLSLSKGPIVATTEEVEANPRARSAKLRIARRVRQGDPLDRRARAERKFAERRSRRPQTSPGTPSSPSSPSSFPSNTTRTRTGSRDPGGEPKGGRS